MARSGNGESRADTRGTSWFVLTDDACYAALSARDPRFDGLFFVGVSTTGIYCRPICPARTPGRPRCTFYSAAVQAEAAGYRACFRCRPELAPGLRGSDARDVRTGHAVIDPRSDVDAIDELVTAATRRIAEGALAAGSLDDLADELGVTSRHLRRATQARLGVSPIDLATSRRLGLAKQLLQDTTLPMSHVATAAGFGSVRRFNAAFAERMGAAPSRLRRAHRTDLAAGATAIRLDYRAPYAWAEQLAFLRARAIPGVELVTSDAYRRVVHVADTVGTIAVAQDPGRDALRLEVSPSLVPHLIAVVAAVRRQFDLDARPDAILRVLGDDPVIGPLVRARPGLRVPGAFDRFEAAVRALLGQQVSVAAATTLAGRFARAFGTPAGTTVEHLTTRFPTAAEVAARTQGEVASLGVPGARAAALLSLANAVATGIVRLDGAGDLASFCAALVALPGIGPWTANYLAMRARHDPDAFPAADLGVLKALRATAKDSEAKSAAWRPYRAYAVIHLWTSPGGTDDNDARSPVSPRPGAPARARRSADRRVPDHGRGDIQTTGRGDPAEPGAPARRRAARRVLRG